MPSSAPSTAAFAVLALLGALDGCSGPAPSSSGPSTAVSTPQIASVLLPPPDLETAPSASSAALLDPSARAESGSPPIALRPDASLPAEALSHDELPGVSLEIAFVPRQLPKDLSFTGSVDLIASGRMRWVFTSQALPFPARSEIRARHDRYGHVLLWPSEGKYRVLAPGALRTALDEARVDVTPLSAGNKGASSSGYRLGERTRVVSLESSLGKIQLELGAFPEAALGGPLFCRALVELVAIDPSTSECKDGEIPLYARVEYASGEGIDVQVTSLTKRTDIVPAEAVCPPPGAEYQPSGLPERDTDLLGTPGKRPVSLTEDRAVTLDNQTERLLYFFLDGVPIAIVPAHASRMADVLAGRHQGQWRTFLGDEIVAPASLDAPGIVSLRGF